MAFPDITVPADSDYIALGAGVIRALQANLIKAMRPTKDTTVNRPAATDEGLFFDTTRNALQRSTGSAYEDIGTLLPATTAMVFYQASAPVGWTAVAVNDKFLRVVTAGGTGGTTGGTMAASTDLTHTHAVGNHTHDMTHMHNMNYSMTGQAYTTADTDYICSANADNASIFKPVSGSDTTLRAIKNQTANSATTDTGAGSGTSGNGLTGAFAYADIVICTKS